MEHDKTKPITINLDALTIAYETIPDSPRMNPERWRHVVEIFHAALVLPPQDRVQFLTKACAGDCEVRSEIESLIISYEAAGDFIEQPVEVPPDFTFKEIALPAPESDMTGRRIGAYRLVNEIGRGGMGTVFLAERADSEFRKQVAIKLVNRGMNTDFILRRFRQERQALAALDHPNIARLLDGGATENGLPYIVMEYVKGTPLTSYCDEQRLTIRERLQLFLEVCAGVSHAHRCLVIHRDLKPSNILVTPDGIPKLLDFGIAKILDPSLSEEALEETATALRMMTPEYASPEQINGARVTTASDVYSLGVLLYLLLTGRRPYHFSTREPDYIARFIGEHDPPRPSAVIKSDNGNTSELNTSETASFADSIDEIARDRSTAPDRLRRSLADDLDNIVLKALRQETSRRYQSVEQFSEDIARHLAGLPVTARADTFVYRSSKFIRRHKAAVSGSLLILLTLIGGAAATTWQAHVARAERARAEAQSARAERRFNDLRRLTHSLMFELQGSIQNLQGATPARVLLAERTLEYLDSLADEARDDTTLQSELVISYINLGDVQGNPFYSNIGDAAGAVDSYSKAARLAEMLSRAAPQDWSMRRRLWLTQIKLGDMHASAGDTRRAEESYRYAQSIIEELSANTNDKTLRQDLGSTYDRNGNLELSAGRFDAALLNYRKAQAIFEELSGADPTNDALLRSVAAGHGKIGKSLLKMNAIKEAIAEFRALLKINEARLAARPADAVTRDDVAGSLGAFAEVQAASGDFSDARQTLLRQLNMYRDLSSADPTNIKFRYDMALAYKRLGDVLQKQGNAFGVQQSYARSVEVLRNLPVRNP